jgi:IS30 family transposase
MGCKYQQLSKGDRIKIHTLLFCNKTQKEIAQELKVHPSAISLLNNRPRKTLIFNTPNEFFSLTLCLIKKCTW